MLSLQAKNEILPRLGNEEKIQGENNKALLNNLMNFLWVISKFLILKFMGVTTIQLMEIYGYDITYVVLMI